LKSTLFSMNISDGNAYETGDPLTLWTSLSLNWRSPEVPNFGNKLHH
jgi:hypothetical protein